jgi:ribosomal 50S subunit-associated protein YjgA (DUF615 family)
LEQALSGSETRTKTNENTFLREHQIYNKVQRINDTDGALWLFLNAHPAMKSLKSKRLINSTQHSHRQSQHKKVPMAKSFKRE